MIYATPGRTLDETANRLVNLRKLARLERKEFGVVSAGVQRKIAEALAAAEAVCIVDDARTASSQARDAASMEARQ